jgi:hypothetical protein
MSRINGYGVTGNELQAMVNERILLGKGSIPATNRCLTQLRTTLVLLPEKL